MRTARSWASLSACGLLAGGRLCLHAGEARADKTETAGDVVGIALPGHAAAAFQAAAFVQRRYDDVPAWPGYVLATYCGWTRVEAKKHFTSDVLAGAALGIGSSFLFVKRRDVSVSTTLLPDGFEIRLVGNLR